MTSGNEAALKAVMELAYAGRAALGDAWPRLLDLGLLWCGLGCLLPRYGATPREERRWSRWLAWFRRRDLWKSSERHFSPTEVAKHVARIESLLWKKSDDRQESGFRRRGGIPSPHGLSTWLLERMFSWLLAERPAPVKPMSEAEAEERFHWLQQLLDFQLWRNGAQRDDTETPEQFGYSLLWAIAGQVPHHDVAKARALWGPVFEVGGNRHRFVEGFMEAWLRQVATQWPPATIGPHWQAMIGVALKARWCEGRNWYHGERMIVMTLGLGSESVLDQQPGYQVLVGAMKPLYAAWSLKHLGADEDTVARFCGFLRSKTGKLLRVDAVRWLRDTRDGERGWRDWRRSSTGNQLVGFLDTVVTEDADALRRDDSLRTAYLDLVAYSIDRQVSAAMALQEKAHRILV